MVQRDREIINEQGGTDEADDWQPETDEDVALEEHAKRMMELRKGVEEQGEILRKVALS